MTLVDHHGPAVAAPAVEPRGVGRANLIDLSLPGIHCAGCMARVERGLLQSPDVSRARVNLGRKQVRITCDADLTPEAMIGRLSALGIEARPLETALLSEGSGSAGRALLLRVAVAGFAMMNVMLLSVAVWSGASDATRWMFHWISAAIALPAVAFCAQPFLSNAWTALRARRLTMDVPISLAIVLASAMSLYETAAGGHDAYFDAALSLTFFLLVGRYLDHRSRVAARSAVAELAALEVPRVIRLTADGRETVALSRIAVDDRVVVLPGARVPVDGLVIEGRSDIDRSFMTGESLPVMACPGTAVAAGEMNLTGPLTVRVKAVGESTALRRMVTMVDNAESTRNRYTAIADRAAAIYAPAVHLLALAAFATWLAISGDLRVALNVAVAVLIITCPCALGLAVPAVSTAAAGRLFRMGFLIKDGTALERLAEVDTVVFDKTGTLTDGQLRIGGVTSLSVDQRSVALALAEASSHPVARAIASGLAASGIRSSAVSDITEHTGRGAEGRWQGRVVRLGSSSWIGCNADAGPAGYLQIGDAPAIVLPLVGELRAGAADAVAAIAARGTAVHLLSGDTEAATRGVAASLGIKNAAAGMSPEDKVAYLAGLARSGHKVLMVGDGLNDTAALAAAHVSLSPATAADASRAASDIVLLRSSLATLPELLRTARAARRRIFENFAIAAGYNLIAIPFALAGLATPLAAAIAMSASSISVLLNALRVGGRT